MGQTRKHVDLSMLSPEQRDAFVKFYRDCRAWSGQRDEIAKTAQSLFREFVRAPSWHITDGPNPGTPPTQSPRDLWHVGAPEVKYVDKIERDA